MIVCKVVDKNTRYGSNYIIYTGIFEGDKKFDKLLTMLPDLKPYFPKYKKGKIIKAVPKSIGLMSFESYDLADQFIHGTLGYTKRAMIIRCEAKGILPTKQIKKGCGSAPERLINAFAEKTKHGKGVVFSEELEVLE